MANGDDAFFRTVLTEGRRFEFEITQDSAFLENPQDIWASLLLPTSEPRPSMPRGFGPVFNADHRRMLGQLIAVADGGWALADFARWFTFEGSESADGALEVLRGKLGLKVREVVTSSGGSRRLDCHYIDDGQPYLGRHPKGIDARFAWGKGEAGERTYFGLLDEGVDLEHPAIPSGKVCVVGSGINVLSAAQHGTKTLGIIAAPRGAAGIDGIADGLESIYFAPVRSKASGAPEDALALLEAIFELRLGRGKRPGGVLLVNRFFADRGQQPIEESELMYRLIRLATYCGLIVIEPAGNGGDPVSRERDSGATIVGAAIPPGAAGNRRNLSYRVEEYSNYAERVDCYGWGRCVRTSAVGCRYGDFDGTSAAASMVAGIALVVQGAAQKKGRLLTPHQMRRLLSTGYAEMIVDGSSTEEARYVPNLRYILERSFPELLDKCRVDRDFCDPGD